MVVGSIGVVITGSIIIVPMGTKSSKLAVGRVTVIAGFVPRGTIGIGSLDCAEAAPFISKRKTTAHTFAIRARPGRVSEREVRQYASRRRTGGVKLFLNFLIVLFGKFFKTFRNDFLGHSNIDIMTIIHAV